MLRRNPKAPIPRIPGRLKPLSGRTHPVRQDGMSAVTDKQRRKGPIALGELVGRAIEPVTAKRGFATADLIAAWPEIAGPLYAGCTAPERIAWRRHSGGDEPAAGTLLLRVDGPRAVFVQHDLPQILERVNAFFGYRAIGQIRIIQSPVTAARTAQSTGRTAKLDPSAEQALAEELGDIDDERLRAALARLGRGVHGSRSG
jgi:hypothetical protein